MARRPFTNAEARYEHYSIAVGGQGYLTVTGTVFTPQGDLKFTAKVPARLLTDTTVYLTGPPPSPRDSEKTAMSGQLLVVAVTRALPVALTVMVLEPPPARTDNELSLTDSMQRPPSIRRSGSRPADTTVPAVASPRRSSAASGGFAPSPFWPAASSTAGARSSIVPGDAVGD